MDNHSTRASAELSLQQVQAPLEGRLSTVTEEIRRLAAELDTLGDVNAYLEQARGRFLRSTLLLLCSELGGARPPQAPTQGAIVEMVHYGMRVHDLAVDHSVGRRGMPTQQGVAAHQDLVLLGDFLYTRAILELSRIAPIEQVQLMAQTTTEMAEGEMRQLASSEALELSEAEYDRLAYCKTAALIATATNFGAGLGLPAHRETLTRFGRELGMALHLANDVLEYAAPAGATRATAQGALREHRVTLPLLAALASMPVAERSRVEEFMATPEPPQDGALEEIAELVRRHGGVRHARERALEHARNARAALSGLPDSPQLRALHASVDYVLAEQA